MLVMVGTFVMLLLQQCTDRHTGLVVWLGHNEPPATGMPYNELTTKGIRGKATTDKKSKHGLLKMGGMPLILMLSSISSITAKT